MKLGAMSVTFRQPLREGKVTLADLLKVVSDLGLKAFELQDNCGFDQSTGATPSKKEIKTLAEVADSYGIKMPVVSAMKMSLLDSEINRNLAYVEKWLQLASVAGAESVKVSIGDRPKGMSADRAFQLAHDGLTRCVRLAEDHSLVLSTELYPESFPASDANAIITLLRTLGPEHFQHVLDNEHVPAAWGLAAYSLLAEYAHIVHASVYPESMGKPTARVTRSFISKSGKPFGLFSRDAFEEYFSILRARRYDGYVSVEWRGPGGSLQECVGGLRESIPMVQGFIDS